MYLQKLNTLKPKGELRLQEDIKELTNKMEKLANRVKKIDPPKPMEWYPGGYGYRFNVSNTIFENHPKLKSLRDTIKAYIEEGMMTIEEEVNMIPTFFLDLQPHYHVLEICADQKSKTAHLVDRLYEQSKDYRTFDDVTGNVVVNVQNKKLYHNLSTELERLGPLFKSIRMTNYEAEQFSEDKHFLFDAILCDVMSSGDGTLRQSLDEWTQWTPQQALPLHKNQIGVVERAIQLLKPGGHLVFSSSSLNPIEDEAILAEILRRHKGVVRLSNQHDRLKKFDYSSGVSSWVVTTPDNTILTKAEYLATPFQDRESIYTYYSESMFPPTEEEAKWMNLHYGIRIIPHYQNSGGCFIAVLEKTTKRV